MKRSLHRVCLLGCILTALLFSLSASLAEQDRSAIPEPEAEEAFGGSDGGDLFAQYVQRLFDTRSTVRKKTAAYPVGSRFTGINAQIYSQLAVMIQEAAAGDRTSTQFTVTLDASAIEQTEFTAQELGVDAVVVDGVLSKEALIAAENKLGFNSPVLMRALVADYPYEMYWFNKTVGIRRQYLFTWKWDQDLNDFTLVLQSSAVLRFTVNDEYALDTYTINPEPVLTARQAAENAREIVRQYASLPDYEKLDAYRTAICDLVSYDYAALDDSSYSNSYQLVWVFDSDPGTNVVCEGYAKAFQFLCDASSFQREIICRSITGWISGGRHMWNIVTMPDGRNYLTDITNCDTGMAGADTLLFLAAAESFNEEEGLYWFAVRNGSMWYRYTDETLELYAKEELTLSADAFDRYLVPAPDVSGLTQLTLPDSLSRIEANALEGTAAELIVMPQHAVTVDALAFAGCHSLQAVLFPGPAYSLDASAFRDCPQVILLCREDSAVPAFARENHIRYAIVPDDYQP